jgi:predicted RNase H-like HicB family nuclease
MEVTQRLQPIQDEPYQLFSEIEGQGATPKEVVTAAKQCLEGHVNEAIIQEFVEKKVMEQQQVESS